ncbi:hypothetical protein ZHAS_00002664 [Anopheles sinensis]|uniref:Uncharacterized protein n=1 Tax=Anopheles sinensis TaxID=74873 RepID=A0A084VCR7_ANOSI|nr:hypothetical protein ZHAS_00002664 [Anopheles sinensis]
MEAPASHEKGLPNLDVKGSAPTGGGRRALWVFIARCRHACGQIRWNDSVV